MKKKGGPRKKKGNKKKHKKRKTKIKKELKKREVAVLPRFKSVNKNKDSKAPPGGLLNKNMLSRAKMQ